MKKIISIIIFWGLLTTVNAQNIQYRIIEETPYASNYNLIYGKIDGMLEKGQIVTPFAAGYGRIDRESINSRMKMAFRIDGTTYHAVAKNFLPVDTEDLFSSDLVINYNKENEYLELWCPVYYCDVLQSKERDTLTKHEPGLLAMNGFDPAYMEDRFWYDYKEITDTLEINEFDIDGGRFVFYSSVMRFGNITDFLIKNIRKINNGYIVTCCSDEMFSNYPGPNFNWDLVKEREIINLLLLLDGDYLDIFDETQEKDNYFGTIVRVKEEFIRQYNNLIKTNVCDLTNVQWPRRANGSMDYPPPEVSNNTPAQQTLEKPVEITRAVENQENVVTESNTSSPTLPLWAWVAIIGGAVVVAGAVLFIMKLKK